MEMLYAKSHQIGRKISSRDPFLHVSPFKGALNGALGIEIDPLHFLIGDVGHLRLLLLLTRGVHGAAAAAMLLLLALQRWRGREGRKRPLLYLRRGQDVAAAAAVGQGGGSCWLVMLLMLPFSAGVNDQIIIVVIE